MALEDSRYCYSPTEESNSPALPPNSPNSFSRNSSTASSPATVCDIKMSSKHGIAVDDEDMDINVDDDEVEDYKTTSTTKSNGQLNIGKFSFSITNILSDTFGTPKNIVKTEQPENNHPSDSMKLFRPFEIKNFIANNSVNRAASFMHQNFNPSSVFLNSFRLSEIFNDYSTKASNVDSKPSDNSLRNSIYNTFSSYPKIHEEILNHKAAKLSSNNNILQSQTSSSSIGKLSNNLPPTSSSSSSSHALGGLCKTISQIGQENCLSPPPRHSATSLTTSSNKSYSEKSTESTIDSDDCQSEASLNTKDDSQKMWPAWIFCTRYSDRPSSGPRYRRPKEKKEKNDDEKRPRTAFSNEQLQRLKKEFNENRYLSEKRRQALSAELGLNEAQIKIWFQNKRAKMKKSSGAKNPLALQLMAQGLYNHSTVALTKEEEELELRMNGQLPSM